MKMHGCIIGFEHGPHGHGHRYHGHGPHGHHHRGHHKHGHHKFGHLSFKHQHFGHHGPHYPGFGHGGFGPLQFGPGAFGFAHAVPGKHGPSFGNPLGQTQGMYDRFIDNNGFEWRLHLPSDTDSSDSETGKKADESEKEIACENERTQLYRSTCRRWGKHGRKMMIPGYYGHLKQHKGQKNEGKKRDKCGKRGKSCAGAQQESEMEVEIREEVPTPQPTAPAASSEETEDSAVERPSTV